MGDVPQLDVQATISSIGMWIQRQLHIAEKDGIVIGVSGGVDSAVALGLCGRYTERVRALILKCHSTGEDIQHARMVSSRFGINPRNIDLTPTYDLLCNTLGSFSGRSAEGNIKSRLRMCALYADANTNGYLVCGTTNLTELTTGYYTKYGDGGVDIEPLAGLLKREVRAIASALGVPDEIIYKRPSAGLYPGQFDEDELGYPYEALDDATSSLVFGTNFKVPPVARDAVNLRMLATEHKRRMPPRAMGCVVRR